MGRHGISYEKHMNARSRLTCVIFVKTMPVPAFDRAGDILIADLRDRGRDLRFCGSLSSTMGRRVAGDMKPSRQSAYFSAAGLSFVSAAVNGTSRSCRYLAVCGRPSLQFEKMVWHNSGATFETTEMQPSPPLAMNASAVASSPDNSRNPVGSRRLQAQQPREVAGSVLQPDEVPGVRRAATACRPITRAWCGMECHAG